MRFCGVLVTAKSDRSGLSLNIDFHTRGVNCSTALSGWIAIRCVAISNADADILTYQFRSGEPVRLRQLPAISKC